MEPSGVHSVQNVVNQSANLSSSASATRAEQGREELVRILAEALELLEHSAPKQESSSSGDNDDFSDQGEQ